MLFIFSQLHTKPSSSLHLLLLSTMGKPTPYLTSSPPRPLAELLPPPSPRALHCQPPSTLSTSSKPPWKIQSRSPPPYALRPPISSSPWSSRCHQWRLRSASPSQSSASSSASSPLSPSLAPPPRRAHGETFSFRRAHPTGASPSAGSLFTPPSSLLPSDWIPPGPPRTLRHLHR